MLRLALTGRELAELYLLNAMGVPSEHPDFIDPSSATLEDEDSKGDVSPEQYMYLVDTRDGREKLLQYADDFYENIKSNNDERLNNAIQQHIQDQEAEEMDASNYRPEETELKNQAFDFLISRMNDYLPEAFTKGLDIGRLSNWYSDKQLRFNFSSLRGLRMLKMSQVKSDVFNNDVQAFADEVEKIINSSTINWDDVIWGMWESEKYRNRTAAEAIEDFQSSLINLINDKDFLDDYWQYYFDDNQNSFEPPEPDWDEAYEAVMEEGGAHQDIERNVIVLHNAIEGARYNGTRKDFLAVLAAIDEISALAHHGGPAFEYADTGYFSNPEADLGPKPSLTDIMHRKYGDRFIGYALSHGLFPEEYRNVLQQWYDERVEGEAHERYLKNTKGETSRETERKLLREDYYKHPYYSQREQWVAENSPTFNEWTPYSPEYENAKNLDSLQQASNPNGAQGGLPRGGRPRRIDRFVREEWGRMTPEQYEEAQDLLGADALPPRSRLSSNAIKSRLLKIAGRIDGYATDLSDELDKLLIRI
jgi:hypothetical protein